MKTLFTNAHIWDGSGAARTPGEVLVADNRIEAVAERWGALPRDGATVVDGAGATLIPGLVDTHSHISFPPAFYPGQIEDTPPEESVLFTMHNARAMLDAGFTGLVGAGSPKLRTEVVIRNEINAGRIPGPRLLASCPTLTATGGLNDTRQMHQDNEYSALIVDSEDEARHQVRLAYREGVDLIKVNVSGDDFLVRPGGRATTIGEPELKVIAEVSHGLGLLVAVHSRSDESIRMSLRQRIDIIHHGDFASDETLDLIEAAKDWVVMTPSIGYLHDLLHKSGPFGITPAILKRMDVEGCLECCIKVHSELRRRGVRHAVGSDYGLPWEPHGTQANELEHFVNYLGYKPAEALRCGTSVGAQLISKDLGQIKAGFLADLLLVKGDPTQDVKLLQDQDNLLAIMKDGLFHKGGGSAPARVALAA